jgi:hypothetical protein
MREAETARSRALKTIHGGSPGERTASDCVDDASMPTMTQFSGGTGLVRDRAGITPTFMIAIE